MIEEKKDFELLVKATEQVRHFADMEDLKIWYDEPRNKMFSDGNSVGLATFEYPGLYNVHWFFEVRGREALNLARAMLQQLFEITDAKAVRGLIREDLKTSKWGARQVGMKSLGNVTDPKGTYELFCMTKGDFYKEEING